MPGGRKKLPAGGKSRVVCRQQQKAGHQQQTDGNTEKPHQSEISADGGAVVIILRTLRELEDGTRQDEHGGRVVHQYQDMSLCEIAACDVGALGEPEGGQGIPPVLFKEQLLKTFCAHGEGGGVKAVKLFRQAVQKLLSGASLKVGDGNVGFALGADAVHGKAESGGAYTAAYQVCVEQKRFDKAVFRAARNMLHIRLCNPSRRIRPHVYEDGLPEAVYQECGGTAEYIVYHFIHGIGQTNLRIADFCIDIPTDIFYGIRPDEQGILEVGEDLLQDFRFVESVDAEEECPCFS